MDLNNHENRQGLNRLAQFIRPELKGRVADLALKVPTLNALQNHPLYQEYVSLSVMKNGKYPPLPAKHKTK